MAARFVATAVALAAHAAAVVASEGPCDIYGAAGTPCVAAHSLVRALYGSFDGPLYLVRRLSDNATQDIGVLSAGGYADAAAQDSFCGSSPCVVERIYDQSPKLNHLDIGPPGGFVHHPDRPINATRLPVTIGGHPVYGGYFEGDMGYRIDNTTGIAVGNEEETLYMVTSGTHYSYGCCFDYGNAEASQAHAPYARPCALLRM